MPKQVKQPKKRSTDVNEIAFDLVRRSTDISDIPDIPSNMGQSDIPSSISEYMAQIGRKGGQIGGKRRLETMKPGKRKQIAKKAAEARWKNKK